jgi:hypothetical protein
MIQHCTFWCLFFVLTVIIIVGIIILFSFCTSSSTPFPNTRLSLSLLSHPPLTLPIPSVHRDLPTVEDWSLKLRSDFITALRHSSMRPFFGTGRVFRVAAKWRPALASDSEPPSADTFYRNITGVRLWMRLLTEAADRTRIGLITLDASALKHGMIPTAARVLRALTDQVVRAFSAQCGRIRAACEAAVEELQQRPRELQDFTDYVAHMLGHYQTTGEARVKIMQEFRIAKRLFELLSEGGGGGSGGSESTSTPDADNTNITDAEMAALKADTTVGLAWQDAQIAYDEYEQECVQSAEFVNSYRGVAASSLMRASLEAEGQVRELMKKLRSPVLCTSTSPVPDALLELESCEPLLKSLVGSLESYTRHQEVLKIAILGKLQTMVEEARGIWRLKGELWQAIGAWREFMQRLNAPLAHLDGLLTSEDVIAKIQTVRKRAYYIIPILFPLSFSRWRSPCGSFPCSTPLSFPPSSNLLLLALSLLFFFSNTQYRWRARCSRWRRPRR